MGSIIKNDGPFRKREPSKVPYSDIDTSRTRNRSVSRHRERSPEPRPPNHRQHDHSNRMGDEDSRYPPRRAKSAIRLNLNEKRSGAGYIEHDDRVERRVTFDEDKTNIEINRGRDNERRSTRYDNETGSRNVYKDEDTNDRYQHGRELRNNGERVDSIRKKDNYNNYDQRVDYRDNRSNMDRFSEVDRSRRRSRSVTRKFDKQTNSYTNPTDNYSRPRRAISSTRDKYEEREKSVSRAKPGWNPHITPVETLHERDRQQADQSRHIVDENVTITGDKFRKYDIRTWEDTKLDKFIIRNIVNLSGFKTIRPIQAACIPQILDKKDLVGHCETGGGKTLAFVAPIVHRLLQNTDPSKRCINSPCVLVLTPTRELATQNYEAFAKMIQGTHLKVALCFGQMDKRSILKKFYSGLHILVGTPGRIMDFQMSGYLTWDNLKILVLDEADVLMKMHEHLREIINDQSFINTKSYRQTLLFSATVPQSFENLTNHLLRPDYVTVSNGYKDNINKKVEQMFVLTEGKPKKNEILHKYIPQNGRDKTLIFVQNKIDTDYLASILSMQNKIPAESINADRPQDVRSEIFQRFQSGQTSVLVATDVCARGIDIKDLEVVINYDLPLGNHDMEKALEIYMHRIGRTGRRKRGKAINFVDPSEDSPILRELIKICYNSEQKPQDFVIDLANKYAQERIRRPNFDPGRDEYEGFGNIRLRN